MKTVLADALGKEKLFVADVGATGGPEERWKKWLHHCHFYTFDPDPRAKEWSSSATNFPLGLWSEPCEKKLYLMKYPQASSLFEINHEALDCFLNAPLHNQVGSESIQLDTIDRLLNNSPIDFLKIDAEGSELEILKGGSHALQEKCLGLQIEVAFCRRHKGAPLFSDLDPLIREHQFELFQLQREHWIRKNNLFSLDASYQLIWGNALYLLSKRAFLKRLKMTSSPEILLAKYALILLTYRLYDYLYEICEDPFISQLGLALRLKQGLIKQSGVPKRTVCHLFLSLFLGYGKYLFSFSKKRKGRRFNYLRRRIRQIGYACNRLGRSAFAVYDEE